MAIHGHGISNEGTMQLESALEAIFNRIPRPTTNHVIKLFAKNGEIRRGDFARTTKELERFVDSCKDFNIYVAPNPTCRTTGVRHTASDVTHWSWVFFDIDPVCTCWRDDEDELHECITCQGAADPNAAMDHALDIFGDLMYENFLSVPPLRIDSGRGIQCWIRVDDIPLVETAEEYAAATGYVYQRKTARKAMGYWLGKVADMMGTSHGCRLDTSVSDLPRVMRLPGTVNQKTGRETKILIPSRAVYTALAWRMVLDTPPTVFYEEPARVLPTSTPWQTVFSQLTLKAQNYLMYGKDPPNRHETMWHTMVKLNECGIGREQAALATGRANALRGKDYELPAKDVLQVLTQVYGEINGA